MFTAVIFLKQVKKSYFYHIDNTKREYNLKWLEFLQCLKEKKEFEGFFKATARRVVAPYNTMSEICRNQRLPPRGSCHEVTEGVSPPAGFEGAETSVGRDASARRGRDCNGCYLHDALRVQELLYGLKESCVD